jgi:YggT family protein
MSLIVTLFTVLAYAYFVAIMVRVVFSWIGPNHSNPIYRISYDLTEPVLAPIRNLLPGRGMGMDFSPMIVTFIIVILLQVLRSVAG